MAGCFQSALATKPERLESPKQAISPNLQTNASTNQWQYPVTKPKLAEKTVCWKENSYPPEDECPNSYWRIKSLYGSVVSNHLLFLTFFSNFVHRTHVQTHPFQSPNRYKRIFRLKMKQRRLRLLQKDH